MFACPKCGNELIRSYGAEKIKLRTNIVVWSDGICIAKCLKCKSDVSVPISLHLPTGKVLKYEETKSKKT
jgi:predicted nucleic-acid-binding Zn-ribbon protein